MELTEAKTLAERLRRGIRHPEVLSLCEFVLGHMCQGGVLRGEEVERRLAEPAVGRREYMREYMRVRRAKKQAENKS